MAKKITAPHSYEPGKGRPKEYLAYLNEREMAYLRSINGNNMERGPRGLPSFPPEDAVGSSSKAGSTKSTTSSGAGRDSSRGLGQGAGGAAVGRSPSGSSPSSGGNLGGGGKGAPGSSPSSPGGLRGAGGNYGPGSGRPGTTSSPGGGYKGPSSPMGGQGPSYSNDTKAQQEAQVRDAIKAVKNSPAFRNDASSGGIRTLSVGPIGTPVNVGPRVTPTQNRASVVGGWGVQAFNSAMPKAPSLASPMTAPPGYRPKDADQIQRSLYGANKQIYDRVPTGKQFKDLGAGYDERISPSPTPSTSISSQFPSYKYDSPLTPGMTPEDMARRAAMMNQIEQEMRDMGLINRPAVTRTGSPIDAGGIPTSGRDPGKTRSIGGGPSAPTYSGGAFDQENEIQQTAVDRAISAAIAARDLAPKPTPTAPRDRSFSNSFISSAAAATPGSVDLRGAGYGTFNVPDVDRDLAAPEDVPEDMPPSDAYNRSRIGTRIGSGLRGIADLSGERTSYTPGDYDSYRNDGSVVDGTDFQNEGTAPSQDPGTPAPGENPALGPAYPEDNFIEKGLKKAGIWGKLYAGADWAAKKNFDKMTLAEQREEMARWQQLKENTRRNVQGKNNRVGGSTSTTSPGGGITDIGSGGKNEPPRISPVEKETPKTPAQPKEGGPRPSIYYKWDLGVDVPSPTDSDYTLYLKYLQEKAAAKAGMAR